MKVTIKESEQYPFFHIEANQGKWSIEVPDETLERWKRVMEEFWEVQKEMEGVSEEKLLPD